MRDKFVDILTEAVWSQVDDLLCQIEVDEVSEVLLFGYFPYLKLSSLFASTFVRDSKPINLACFGPSFALVDDSPSPDRVFYPYLVIREQAKNGLAYSYCFPYDDWDGQIRLEVSEIVLDNKQARDDILKLEKKIASYAGRWMESEYEKDS